MPTSVSTGAYIAALHKKLAQAERSLYEFRQIFNKLLDETIISEDDLSKDRRRRESPRDVPEDARRKGLHPGQISNVVDTSDADGDVGECIE